MNHRQYNNIVCCSVLLDLVCLHKTNNLLIKFTLRLCNFTFVNYSKEIIQMEKKFVNSTVERINK